MTILHLMGHALAADPTPNDFAFSQVIDVALSTATTSDPVQLQGMTSSASFTCSAGSLIVNGVDLGSSGTVPPNATIRAKLTSSASFSTLVTMIVTISSKTANFDVWTAADPTPSPSPSPTPTPTPPESIMAPRDGAADFTVTSTSTSNTTAGSFGKVLSQALAAMQVDNQPKKIAISPGNYGSMFPTGGLNFPQQLTVVNLDDANPANFIGRLGLGSMQNVLFYKMLNTYNPSHAADPVIELNSCSNVQFSYLTCQGQRGHGRKFAAKGGTNVTLYRANIKSGGDILVSFQQRANTTERAVGHRMIECNIADGVVDAVRIFGVQDFYLARNAIHEIVKASADAHNDAVQVSMHQTASLWVPSGGTIKGGLHYALTADQVMEGFQMTNMLDPSNPIWMDPVYIEDLITIGTEGAGIVHRGSTGGYIKNCECYQTAGGGTNPTIAVSGSQHVSILGANRAYGGDAIGAFQPSGPTGTTYNELIDQNDGVTGKNDPSMFLSDEQVLQKIADWRAANPGVPS